MTTLKAGDRVRIKTRRWEPDYCAGELGTVIAGPNESAIPGVIYFIVAMDKDGGKKRTVFQPHEIERGKGN